MQVARQDILTYFNQIFDGLCKLFADVDVDVKNGSNLLDRCTLSTSREHTNASTAQALHIS